MEIFAFLQHLARSVRQLRTYPASSPLCTDAIEACHAAFVALKLNETLLLRVTSKHLLLGDEPTATDPTIEHDLRRPLHAARVGSIEFDRSATARDWTTLCSLLASASRPGRDTATVAERLLDAGVNAIVPRMTPQPEVFDVGAPNASTLRLVTNERTRQAEAASTSGPAQYLYPPDKGWVRTDLTFEDSSLSLVDLTLLVNDPDELATILGRMADDPAGNAAESQPLRDRYDDVVMLIGALEPHVGRVLLSKLARAVLALDADRRRSLLRQSILPHMLDGRHDGVAILSEFSDVDLADALGLLFDLEAASPQMLSVAFDRLRLTGDRRAQVIPLIEKALQSRDAGPSDRWAAAGFDKRASELTHVAADRKDFSEFTAFDLSIDGPTRAALASVTDTISSADTGDQWLGCVLSLARIEPNPLTVRSLLARAVPAVHGLIRAERWQDATRWLARLGDLAASTRKTRPDVAGVAYEALEQICDRETVISLGRLCTVDAARVYAAMIVAAAGPAIVPAWLEALAASADRQSAIRLRPLMSEHAQQIGPALAARLPGMRADVTIVAVAVLGFAGTGYEDRIAPSLAGDDDALIREGLRALARIASAKSAELVTWHIEHGTRSQAAAEEALWRLPGGVALAKARELLARREFVTRHPDVASRLLERAAQTTPSQLDAVLEALAPLRFHFWNPALARVGARARGLM